MDELRGGVAVVTGGASGIGRALALACAAEGMRVVIADLDVERAEGVVAEIAGSGGSAIAVRTDVSDRASVDALAARTLEEFGQTNLLFCNAGVFFFKDAVDMTEADFKWIFSVNFWGVVNTVYAFLPQLRALSSERGVRHIVNTASMSGLVTRTETIGYASTKYAVMAFSEVLRQELEPEGIGVSVICPAGVRTLLRASERNRPAEFGGAIEMSAEREQELESDFGPERLDPAEVARQALDAVKANRMYVITHAKSWERIGPRFEHIRQDFDAVHPSAEPPPWT